MADIKLKPGRRLAAYVSRATLSGVIVAAAEGAGGTVARGKHPPYNR